MSTSPLAKTQAWMHSCTENQQEEEGSKLGIGNMLGWRYNSTHSFHFIGDGSFAMVVDNFSLLHNFNSNWEVNWSTINKKLQKRPISGISQVSFWKLSSANAIWKWTLKLNVCMHSVKYPWTDEIKINTFCFIATCYPCAVISAFAEPTYFFLLLVTRIAINSSLCSGLWVFDIVCLLFVPTCLVCHTALLLVLWPMSSLTLFVAAVLHATNEIRKEWNNHGICEVIVIKTFLVLTSMHYCYAERFILEAEYQQDSN